MATGNKLSSMRDPNRDLQRSRPSTLTNGYRAPSLTPAPSILAKRTISEDCTQGPESERPRKYHCLQKEAERRAIPRLDHLKKPAVCLSTGRSSDRPFNERPQLPPMREQPNPPNKHPKFNSNQFTLPALQDPGSFTPSSQGNVATAPTGTFKCSHPGCPAAPFQTQYLLNSHANVHLQDRPHFCPIDGCPRGPWGKGFKRKNEMIRHVLVHNS
ncbi:hypothetical protein ASPVEDRAFT_375465 [Aspergillus versicolor CBS 583.65]|uniref:C2H2-type domain-containing protein n=1 Tax=Aspergillus versicolor CBS 583.65 TaxID=1036611 RepID=A0A1L9Q285_ASPVE|nr:uncharacterized protein ASPVEDRAFT_375465 [Aspergillus versicolor CBS 583.65]OJJ07822.1 hypothetical protein ASPVEDRAFT_375465 [Aspergillus versicolor CBS 583.65]